LVAGISINLQRRLQPHLYFTRCGFARFTVGHHSRKIEHLCDETFVARLRAIPDAHLVFFWSVLMI
jgi:hypothetical protein